jgi:hypothetical protein
LDLERIRELNRYIDLSSLFTKERAASSPKYSKGD